MATMDELQQLAAKATVDMNFRKLLLKDPVAAAKTLGIGLTTEQVNSIKSVSPAMFDQKLAQFKIGQPTQEFLW